MTDLEISNNGIFRTHVYGPHEPARLISPDRNNCCVKRPEATDNLAKIRVETCVAREEDPVPANTDNPPAPESRVPIPRVSPREMLRWSAARRYRSHVTLLPPVKLCYMSCALAFQKVAYAKGGYPFRVWKSGSEATHGLLIEVIVMVVRDEDGVNGRELLEGDAGRRVAPGSNRLNWRSPIAPDRIGKDVDSVRLDEKAAMPYPGNCKLGPVGTGSWCHDCDKAGRIGWCSSLATCKHPFKKIPGAMRLRGWPWISKSAIRIMMCRRQGY